MSWTKDEIIKQAFGEIGLAAYVFDLTPEDLEDAVRILDSMMAQWIKNGIVFDPPYPATVSPGGGSLSVATNAPPEAVAPMYYNLAVRLAPSNGKTPSPETMRNARDGYSLLAQSITIPEIQMVGMIRGAGAKTPVDPFILEDTVTGT